MNTIPEFAFCGLVIVGTMYPLSKKLLPDVDFTVVLGIVGGLLTFVPLAILLIMQLAK